mgnify:CR=1 FL=1
MASDMLADATEIFDTAWWFMFFYSVTFGGFVGLASSLTIYFNAEYGLPPVAAGLFTAGQCSQRPMGAVAEDYLGHEPLVDVEGGGEVRVDVDDLQRSIGPAEDIDVDEAENRVEEAEKEISEVSEEAEDRDRVLEEIRRRQRTGENFVRVARKYRGS